MQYPDCGQPRRYWKSRKTVKKATPKEQLLFLGILSGHGQLHASGEWSFVEMPKPPNVNNLFCFAAVRGPRRNLAMSDASFSSSQPKVQIVGEQA
jgi:hypothetical protein